MRGECAVLSLVCALTLAAHSQSVTTTTELNPKWMEAFRRDLMRDSYDYDDPQKTRASTARQPRVTDAPVTNTSVTESGVQDKQNATRQGYKLRSGGIQHDETSGMKEIGKSGPGRLEPGPTQVEPSVRRLRAEQSPARAALDAAPAPLPVRRNAMDEAASREFGISRGDLYGGRSRISGQKLHNPRQDYMRSIHQLEQNLMPVYVRREPHDPLPDPGDPLPDPGDPTGDDHESSDDQERMTLSRKRLSDQRDQRPPYIIQNGIKRYRVNMEPKGRYNNIFGDRGWRTEWDISSQIDVAPPGPEDFKYEATQTIPWQEDEPRNEGSSETQEGRDEDVSQYQQSNTRSRYEEGERWRRTGGPAQHGASAGKTCDCQKQTGHARVTPRWP